MFAKLTEKLDSFLEMGVPFYDCIVMKDGKCLYRHYDKFNKEVQFPFGFGLSYADFAYSNLLVKKVTETE